jgi:dihydrolipoamide dehydrogenase
MVVGDIETGAEVLVIGGGPGGYSAAIRAAQNGADVKVIEKGELGGVCLNRGCIPAKSLIHAAGFQKNIEHWNNIGIHTDELNVDYEEIQAWKNGIVNKLNQGIKSIFEREDIEVINGEARFIDENTVRVEEEHRTDKIKFEKCIIATGSKPVEIPSLEFDKDGIISSKELLELEEVPDELVVVGGGYIGMEAVTKFCKFGAKVKIVEARDRVLKMFPEEIVDNIQETSACYNDEIYESTKAESVEYKDGKPVLIAETEKGEEREIEGDYILVAAGRDTKELLENLEVENAGLSFDENGFIDTDTQMKASKNIYAVGDITGGPMLAHKAYMEGKVAGEAAAGEKSGLDSEYIPKVMYTDPEVAMVGMTEEEAGEKYDDLMIGKFNMSHSGRALTTENPDGYVKVVACPKGKLLGAQIVSPRASDMIAEATLALEMQAYLNDIIGTIHAHPTFPEAFQEACEDAKNKSVHT